MAQCVSTWFITQPAESILQPDLAALIIAADEAANPQSDDHYFRLWAVLTCCYDALVHEAESAEDLHLKISLNVNAVPDAIGILLGSNFWLSIILSVTYNNAEYNTTKS